MTNENCSCACARAYTCNNDEDDASIEDNWGEILDQIQDPEKRQIMKETYKIYANTKVFSPVGKIKAYNNIILAKAKEIGLGDMFDKPLTEEWLEEIYKAIKEFGLRN